MIKQFKMPHLPCPVCGADAPANKVLRDAEERGALTFALEKIAAMDPKGIRADDLGRAARIAREALPDAVGGGKDA